MSGHGIWEKRWDHFITRQGHTFPHIDTWRSPRRESKPKPTQQLWLLCVCNIILACSLVARPDLGENGCSTKSSQTTPTKLLRRICSTPLLKHTRFWREKMRFSFSCEISETPGNYGGLTLEKSELCDGMRGNGREIAVLFFTPCLLGEEWEKVLDGNLICKIFW